MKTDKKTRTVVITRPFHALMASVRLRVPAYVASEVEQCGLSAIAHYCTPRQIRKTRCAEDCCCRATAEVL